MGEYVRMVIEIVFLDRKIILKDKTGEKHIIAEKVSVANNFYSRLMGLMGQKNLLQNHALILSPCNSIHTMFMNFPIDVVYVDTDLKVVKIVKNIQPWKLDFGHRKAKYTIELPSNTINFEPVSLEIQ